MLSETLLPSSLSQKKLEGEMVKSMAFRSGEFLADCLPPFLLVGLLLYICYSINNNISSSLLLYHIIIS